jgi:hypothetical protein
MSYVTDNLIGPRRDRRGRNLEVGFISWFCYFLESFRCLFGAFPACALFVQAVASTLRIWHSSNKMIDLHE